MRLVEEGENTITFLEAFHTGSGSDDCAGAVGGRDNGEGGWEGIFALSRRGQLGKREGLWSRDSTFGMMRSR